MIFHQNFYLRGDLLIALRIQKGIFSRSINKK